jgi:glycosyltransferase involved in cell wall biosynthesis
MEFKKYKLIYILNHYSINSIGHFYHVINLLEVMADKGVEIVLVIEKCDDIPFINNPNISIITQRNNQKWLRPFELSYIIFKLHKQGFSNIYIRISWVAAVIAILTSFITRQKTFYWLSGQGGFEHYKSLRFSFAKIKLFFTSRLPFFFIKKYVYRFVTGPESMKEYFIKVGGVDSNKIIVLYNDIDIKRFIKLDVEEKVALKIKLGLSKDKKIIFFAHRFSPVRKTSYYLPFIFNDFFNKSTDNYFIIIAGGGPDEQEVQKGMENVCKKNQYIFLGSIPNSIIQQYYQVADIFINPTYAEGFPRVLIEAMASGLPIVTSDAGGIKDILGLEQSRYMIPKENRISFAEKLLELANSEEERRILSEENLLTVNRFSSEAVAEMYIREMFNLN